MKKRLSALILAILMLVSLLPTAALAADTGLPFTDVKSGKWYTKAVRYVYDDDLMDGTSATAFSPSKNATRAEVVMSLWRRDGKPDAVGKTFSDVLSDKTYATAVVWADNNGIVKGYGGGKFGPEDSVTREQLAVILYRYCSLKGYDLTLRSDMTKFSDSSTVSRYASAAMSWADAVGLIIGTSKTTTEPKTVATRAQLAMVLLRLNDWIAKQEAAKEVFYTVAFDLNYADKGVCETQQVKQGAQAEAPVQPTRTGYTFNGWYTEKTAGSKFDFAETITADRTLYAHWTANSYTPSIPSYTVSFEMNGHGTQVTSQTVRSGNKATAPTNPTVTGYDFDGWFKEIGCTNEWDFDAYTVTADTTLYAKWTQRHTVTFDMNNIGTQVDPKTVRHGEKITAPTTPTDEGYLFDGWFSDGETFLNEWDFAAYTVTADTILYAKWSTAYTVSFNMNGHGDQVDQQIVRANTTVDEPTDPTVTGYDFDGWFKEIGCTNAWDFNTYTVTDDTTLYAKWTQLHTVTFDMNNIGTQVDPQTVRHGEKITEPTAPTYGTCVFNGWYLDDGTFANQVNFATYTVTADVTLHASWTASVKSVSISINATASTTPGVGKTLGATIYTDGDTIGYSDTGKGAHYEWYQTDVPGTTLSTGSTYTPGVADVDHTISVKVTVDGYQGYATNVTDAVKHTITNVYAISNDTGTPVYQPVVGQTLGVVIETTKGEFTGATWVTTEGGTLTWTPGGSATTYTVQPLDTSLEVEAGNTNYTVERYEDDEWSVSYDTPTYYTVTFATGFSDPTVSSYSATYAEAISPPTAPSKAGYRFDGWYKESTYTTQWSFGSDTVTSDTTLYAKWTEMFRLTVTAAPTTYFVGEPVTYVVSIENVSSTAYTDVQLVDNLGAYTFGSGSRTPLAYNAGTVKYLVGSTLKPAPTVASVNPKLTITGISIPAGETATVAYTVVPNEYAPLTVGSSLRNAVTVTSAASSAAAITGMEVVSVEVGPRVTQLPPVKSGSDYTFVLQNYGNADADQVSLTHTFDPSFGSVAVTLNGVELTAGEDYTFNPATGVLNVPSGKITVPKAALTQDPSTGVVSTTPGTATLVVTDTETPVNLLISLNSTTTTYRYGDRIAYIVSLENEGSTSYTGLTLTNDLGKDTNGNVPCTYETGSVKYYIDNVYKGSLPVTSTSPLTFGSISVPANSTTTISYAVSVNEYAKLALGSSITNTVKVNGTQPVANTTHTVENAPAIKYLSPVVTGNTYTFIIQNFGNKAASSIDNESLTYTFGAGTTINSVNVNGTPWTLNTEYTYDSVTGVFTTVPGKIIVPAATFTEDPSTHKITVTPGVTTVTVTVTEGVLK